MRLINLLTQPGGVSEQGKEITFSLRYTSGRVPSTREVTAYMLPLSERDWADVARLTDEALAPTPGQDGATLPPTSNLSRDTEFVIQFLRICLRDPGDLSARLVEDPRDVQALRDGLVGPQYPWFGKQYRALMANEYKDLVTVADADELHAESRDFSAPGRSAPG